MKWRWMLLATLFCSLAYGQVQWQFVSNFPAGVPANTAYDTVARPYWRQYGSAVYDDVDGGLLVSAGSPSVGSYVNAQFLYKVGSNSWTNVFSHTTSVNVTSAVITALSRSAGVVTATIATAEQWPADATLHRYLGVGTCKVSNTRPPMADPSFATTPVLVNQIDRLDFTYSQPGPDATLTCFNYSCGCAWGMLDSDDSPSDGTLYHQRVWDTSRHVLWKAFGDSNVFLSGGTTYAIGGASDSTYELSSGKWTQICGDITSPCNVPSHEQAAMAYFPDTDRVVMNDGFHTGTKVADTWELNPATGAWAQICSTATCGSGSLVHAHGANLIYFPPLHKAVLLGGQVVRNGDLLCQNNSTQYCNTQVWLYDSANIAAPSYGWTRLVSPHMPPGLWFPVVDYDPDNGLVILVDGNLSGSHVWTFDGNDWTDITAAGLVGVGPVLSSQGQQNFGAYDPSAHRFVVMFKSDSTGKSQIWSIAVP